MTEMTHAYDWHGRELVDRHGTKVGTHVELYVDERTDQPEWAAVRIGLFGKQVHLVPIHDAEPSRGQVRVPFDKDQLEDARGRSGGRARRREEAALGHHYGMAYSQGRSDSGLPEGRREADFGDRACRPWAVT